MVTQINTLRVSAELDASKYTSGAQQKQAADRGMSQSGKEAADGIKAVGDAATQTDTKVSQAGNGIERLKRQFVTGYAASMDFERSLKTIGVGLDKGKLSADQAASAVENLTRKYGQVANAADLAERGQLELSRAVAAANTNMATQAATAEQAVLAQRRMAAAANQNAPGGDGAAQFRRQNLGFQLQDVGVSLYGGMPLTTVLAQQGTQIAGIYAGNGGVNAALKDFGAMVAMAARYLGPFAAAAATAYGAVKLLQSYSVEATLAVSEATKALAAQAAPLGTLQGQINELTSLQEAYSKAIADTGRQSTAATSMIIANTEREFNARKALLELEEKRQQALIATQRAELQIMSHQLQSEVAGSVNTRLDLERRGFADPRVGRFVNNLPDDLTGLEKTRDILDSSPLNDKIKELKANLELTELGAQKLEEALKNTFDASPYGNGDLPVVGPVPGRNPRYDLNGDGDAAAPTQRVSAGLPVDIYTRHSQMMREEIDQYEELRELSKGFASDIINGLRNGEEIGEVFGNAFLNGLTRAADKQIDRLIDSFLSWLLPASGGASASAIPGMSTGVANTTLGAFLGASNDNAPGNMSVYRSAISDIESGGRYDALGPITRNGDRAYGKYQMMGNNIGPWSQAALGRSISSDEFLSNPGMQDQIFDHRFGGYVNKYGPSGAAQAWFGGPGSVGKGGMGTDVLGTSGNAYVQKFEANVGQLATATKAATQSLGQFGTGLGGLSQQLLSAANGANSPGLGGIGSLFRGVSPTSSFWSPNTTLGGFLVTGHADGVEYSQGGTVMVGERGRELVNLPRGSQVIPNHRTENMMSRAANGNGGGGMKVDVAVSVDDTGNLQAYVKRAARETSSAEVGQRFTDFGDAQRRGGINELNKRYMSQKG